MMLTLLINTAIGGIAAVTITSLVISLRAFLPAWRRAAADLAACDNEHTLRVTIRDLACSPEGAVIYRPDFGAVALKPQMAAPRPCLPAAA